MRTGISEAVDVFLSMETVLWKGRGGGRGEGEGQEVGGESSRAINR